MYHAIVKVKFFIKRMVAASGVGCSGMIGLERSTVQWFSNQKDLDLTLSCATLPAERFTRKLMNISEPHFPHLSSGDENNELL